jgi:hypothetical protein
MDFIPHVIDGRHIKGYTIEVKFNDGTIRLVDFKPYVDRGGIFSELRDEEYFKKFFIDLNTVCWPNGADVAPERLYELGEGEPLES